MTTTDVHSSAFAVDITATTPIDAPPERVWAVLVDIAHYPEWNPFVRRFEGAIAVGERITVELQVPGRKPQSMRPTVVVAEEGRRFEWAGHVGVTGSSTGATASSSRTTGLAARGSCSRSGCPARWCRRSARC